MKEIPVKSFEIIPRVCPANFTIGCAPCKYSGGKFELRNPAIDTKSKKPYGVIPCRWDEHIEREIAKEGV